MSVPELFENPEIFGEDEVAVQVKVEAPTEDCKEILVVLCEQI